MWDFFNSETRTARKAYRCDEGRCEIKPGDRYSYNAGKVEGEMVAYRLCLDCDVIAREMVDVFGYDEGYPLTECRSMLRSEHGVEDPLAWALASRAERTARQAAKAARDLPTAPKCPPSPPPPPPAWRVSSPLDAGSYALGLVLACAVALSAMAAAVAIGAAAAMGSNPPA